MVMVAEIGSRTAASVVSDCGSDRTLLGRKTVETKDRIRLEQPETSIRLEVEISILLHFAPTTFATDIAAAVYRQRATPRK